MVRDRRWEGLLLCAWLACACSQRSERELLVGRDPSPRLPVPNATAGRSATGDAEAGRAATAGAGGNGFRADIQSPTGVTLELITVACDGDCFEVEAIARGGFPPYTYGWEDGSTNPVRMLCPNTTAEFSVTVTDQTFEGEEFSHAAQTVHAAVTAQVLECPGNTPADAGPDATPPGTTSQPLCLVNGSFEESTGDDIRSGQVSGWHDCTTWTAAPSPLVVEGASEPGYLDPADGTRYVRLISTPISTEEIGQTLCEPTVAGETYYLSLMAALAPGSAPMRVEVLLDDEVCGYETIAVSTLISAAEWKPLCVPFVAPQAATHVLVRVSSPDNNPGELLVDALSGVRNCDGDPRTH